AVIAIPFILPMFQSNEPDPALDNQRMERLNKAIENYATINRQYPSSLDALVPEFLAAVPVNSTNMPFNYDPATGVVTNPAPAVETEGTRQSTRSGGGGISPATDAMTGLSVSEELNF